MTDPRVTEALARMDSASRDFRPELRDLIRDVSMDTHECVCGVLNPGKHAKNCTLIAFCCAITGEKK